MVSPIYTIGRDSASQTARAISTGAQRQTLSFCICEHVRLPGQVKCKVKLFAVAQQPN